MKDRYILDACALITYLNDENGAETVERLLDGAESGEYTITMGKINLLEVYYGLFRQLGQKRADEILEGILALPIQIIGEMNDELFFESARIKASHKVSLADALALGLASITDSQFVTSDHHELDSVEAKESIKFLWIR